MTLLYLFRKATEELNGFHSAEVLGKKGVEVDGVILSKGQIMQAGVQKVGSAGTAGTGQTKFSWTKQDLDGKIIRHIMARAKKSCHTLTNWTFGSLTSDINTLSNKIGHIVP